MILLIREAGAVRGEKAAAMPPEQGPDLFAVCAGQGQGWDFIRCDEFEAAFRVRGREVL